MSSSASDPAVVAKLAEISRRAPFNVWLDFEIVTAVPGEVAMRLRRRDDFTQYSGFLHAGVVAGLLDTACGFAASTAIDGYVLATQLSVRYLRPAVAEAFVVRGWIVKPGNRQIFASAALVAEGADAAKPFALGDATLVPAN